jgi:hypothetical protein
VKSTSRLKLGKSHPAALITLVLAALVNTGNAQEIAVQNESGATVKFTSAEIASLPHQELSVNDHGKTARYDGAPVRLLLERAGVTFGESLRGKRLASCLLAEGQDGYRVVFALPELDPEFTDGVVLLADKVDGHPLGIKEGPFRIVVSGEKRMARWVRQVTLLKVVQVQ